MGDEMRGGRQDVSGRAIVALEPDHLRARKVVLEAQDVVDLRPAPAIDRLIVVADAADVGGEPLGARGRRTGRRRRIRKLGQACGSLRGA